MHEWLPHFSTDNIMVGFYVRQSSYESNDADILAIVEINCVFTFTFHFVVCCKPVK